MDDQFPIKFGFVQGFVDGHFVELELLEDGDNLHFTEEIITLFFTDSARLIVDVEKELLVL